MNIIERRTLQLRKTQVGASMVEYTVLLSLIGMVSIGAVSVLGVNVSSVFSSVFGATSSGGSVSQPFNPAAPSFTPQSGVTTKVVGSVTWTRSPGGSSTNANWTATSGGTTVTYHYSSNNGGTWTSVP